MKHDQASEVFKTLSRESTGKALYWTAFLAHVKLVRQCPPKSTKTKLSLNNCFQMNYFMTAILLLFVEINFN